MDTNFPPLKVPASPEYVLSVIVDHHRQQCQFDPEADPEAVLTFDTTVAKWREACDLVAWRKLGRALNEEWAIRCTDGQWESALKPPRRRTLRDVCGLIAAHATREVIRPAMLLGEPCAAAGAFLTIRSLVGKAGARADEIGPSTPLAPFLGLYTRVFLGPISRLAPGTLPPVRIRTPYLWGAALGLALSVLMIGMGWLVGAWCTVAGALSAGVFLIGANFGRRPASSVEFGSLKTFGDLARFLARAPAPGQANP